MRRTRPRTLLCTTLAALLLTLGPLPASADNTDLLPATLDLRQRTAQLRHAATSGSIGQALRGLADFEGLPTVTVDSSLAEAPHDMPRDLREPVTTLLRGLDRAQITALDVVASVSDVDLSRLKTLRGAPDLPVPTMLAVPIDRARLLGGALALADAVDKAVPELAARAWAHPGSGGVGCDVYQSQHICIGGSGPNVHSEDHLLVIDLGGDDQHLHSAGGAGIGAAFGGPSDTAASLTIDLSGDDTYQHEPDGLGAAQGAAADGGIGMLADLSGNDTYAAESLARDSYVMAQGSALLGVGVLFDAAGNDVYQVTSHDASGMGVGYLAGIGAFIDGGGDDTYRVSGVEAPGEERPVFAQGFGFGYVAGSAVFVDAGGTDTMSLTASSAQRPPDSDEAGPAVSADGIGIGVYGTGVALSGAGPTNWLASASTQGATTGGAHVFAMGLGGGIASYGQASGVLADAGGDDTYRMTVDNHATRHHHVGNCAVDCAAAHAHATTNISRILGGAYGYGYGLALLEDNGGDDEYVAEARVSAEAIATTDWPGSVGVGASADAANGDVYLGAWSVAQFATEAAMLDVLGDDRYVLSAQTSLTADADAPGGPDHEQVHVQSGVRNVFGQAMTSNGSARLHDLGGTDDYVARNLLDVVVPVHGTRGGPGPTMNVQGTATYPGSSWLVDADGSTTADTFTSDPYLAPCTGQRGDRVWRDCVAGAGGSNT